jgi:hypothetical protein
VWMRVRYNRTTSGTNLSHTPNYHRVISLPSHYLVSSEVHEARHRDDGEPKRSVAVWKSGVQRVARMISQACSGTRGPRSLYL